MSRFTDPLLVTPLPDGRTWVIERDFGYDVGSENSGDRVNVPVGFETDFASVPRPLWLLFSPWGVYGNAAVIHDYLYTTKARTRENSDKIFSEAMGVLKTPRFTRWCLYHAVRWFGWSHWRK